MLQPGLNKGHWTAEEDIVVRCEVAKAEAAGTVSDAQVRKTKEIRRFVERVSNMMYHTLFCVYPGEIVRTVNLFLTLLGA